MNKLREIAYRVDPVLWVREALGIDAYPWQQTFLRAPRGASILALTGRQVGKTTTAAWAIAPPGEVLHPTPRRFRPLAQGSYNPWLCRSGSRG